MIDLTKSVGPFVGISRDQAITFENERSFRVIVYGAYNAHGLYGSEKNGIAILDEDRAAVVCDEICKESSGYFGPSDAQIAKFDEIVDMEWSEFQGMVNVNRRTRSQI